MADSTVKIEEATLVGYRVQGAQRNRDGDELEGPRVLVTLKVPLERIEAHLGTFARLIKRDRVIKFLEFRFIEQLELEALRDDVPVDPQRVKDPLGTFPASSRNGHNATLVDDLAVEHDTAPRHIGAAIKKRERAKT